MDHNKGIRLKQGLTCEWSTNTYKQKNSKKIKQNHGEKKNNKLFYKQKIRMVLKIFEYLKMLNKLIFNEYAI